MVQIAEEEFTVFYGVKDAGNQKPVTGWVAGEMKVAKISNGSELKKNKPCVQRESGTSFFTSKPQQCFFVTVNAESEEEAALVVDKFLAQGFTKETGESFTGGPKLRGPFVNTSGKAVAAKVSSIKEVTGWV